MIARFNPELLLLARQYRAKSQAEVAEAAGLDQGHYSRVERGLLSTDPSDSTIGAIARALAFPVSFFTQDDDVVGLPLSVHDVAWRKKASVGAGELKRLHAELNVRIMNMRRLLNAVDLSPELTLPRIDPDEVGGAVQVARQLRRAWMIPAGPVKNLTALCERAGIIVVMCDFPEHVDGLTMRLRDLPALIFLNRAAPADRLRFSLAHELGHLIMHAVPTDEMEEQADQFAGELLVPFDQLRSDLIGGRVTLERLVQLKLYWRVSVASLLYRSGHGGIIQKSQADYLWRQLSMRGWRKTEPPETQFEREKTTVFDHVVRLHTDKLGYSALELSTMLNLDETEAAHLYGVKSQQTTRPALRVVR